MEQLAFFLLITVRQCPAHSPPSSVVAPSLLRFCFDRSPIRRPSERTIDEKRANNRRRIDSATDNSITRPMYKALSQQTEEGKEGPKKGEWVKRDEIKTFIIIC